MLDPRETLGLLLQAGIRAADPRKCVHQCLRIERAALALKQPSTGRELFCRPIGDCDHVYLVGCGKAAVPMALAVEDILGERLDGGVVTTKYGHCGDERPKRIRVIEAGHPEPDARGMAGAGEALEFLRKAGRRDLVIAVVSGGGSALWPLPVPGVSLEDEVAVTRALLASGATIHEMNTVRRHLSSIKGGGAARAAANPHTLVLVVSDVIGDDLGTIASGPFSPGTTTSADALRILTDLGILSQLPAVVKAHLEQRVRDASVSPEATNCSNVTHCICVSNAASLEAIRYGAGALGLEALVLPEPIVGEARSAAVEYCRRLSRITAEAPHKPICVISGGETTVTLGPRHGKGGRNQEFALASALELRRTGAASTTVLSCGTDGTDGPTDAAGGVVDASTVAAGAAAGLDATAALESHDSYSFLDAAGGLLVTGPTGTNVMDVQVALIV